MTANLCFAVGYGENIASFVMQVMHVMHGPGGAIWVVMDCGENHPGGAFTS